MVMPGLLQSSFHVSDETLQTESIAETLTRLSGPVQVKCPTHVISSWVDLSTIYFLWIGQACYHALLHCTRFV